MRTLIYLFPFVAVCISGAFAEPGNFYYPANFDDGKHGSRWAPQARSMSCADKEADRTWPPKDYKLVPNLGYYKFYAFGATWLMAKQICEEDGAHLAIINSEREVAAMREFYAAYPASPQAAGGSLYAWIGMRERGVNGQWFTIFGDPVSEVGFYTWSGAQKAGVEDGGLLALTLGGYESNPVATKHAFICEIELSQVQIRREMLNAAKKG